MAEYTIIKLNNLSPIHIGTGKDNYDYSESELHSDTITAALSSIRAQEGRTEDIDKFLSSFVMSSAFPYWGDCYFLPKMQGKINITVNGKDEYEYRKYIKKIKFIEIPIWKRLVNGETVVVDEQQIQGAFLICSSSIKEMPCIYKSRVSERVSIPRGDGQDADPFFFEWKYFNDNCGLYCLTTAENGLLDEILSLFRSLGENGIGTDRSVGGGNFEIDSSTITVDDVSGANAIMLLSLYVPTHEELTNLNLQNSKYSLLLRGGYIAGSQNEEFRHLRKKSIYMFDVGSVFQTIKPIIGKIEDLKPSWNDPQMHHVYRSGRALYLPIKI